MIKTVNTFLQFIDIYDYLLIFRNKYFKSKQEKNAYSKRISFYSKLVNQGDLCFDVGANYGNRCEVFLKLGAKVIAFEPQPKPIIFLKRKFGNKIVIVDKALGFRESKGNLYISSASTLTSMSEEWITQVKRNRFKKADWNKRIEIEVTTLDLMIENYGVPDFCKIDVEGYELEVLKGLSQPVKIISFEFTIPEFYDRAVECINYLDNLGAILCNYSSGETMEFALMEWIKPEKFIPLFRDIVNQGIIDGDIYIKFI